MRNQLNGCDVVIPRTKSGYEPLFAFYSKDCLSPIKRQMDSGNLKIIDFLPRVKIRAIGPEELSKFDPRRISFFNINAPGGAGRGTAYSLLSSQPLKGDTG